jgi:hypothetical protein
MLKKLKKLKYFWVTFIAAVVKQFALKWICSHLCFRQKLDSDKYQILQLGTVASSALFLALCSLTTVINNFKALLRKFRESLRSHSDSVLEPKHII